MNCNYKIEYFPNNYDMYDKTKTLIAKITKSYSILLTDLQMDTSYTVYIMSFYPSINSVNKEVVFNFKTKSCWDNIISCCKYNSIYIYIFIICI